jgi:hypothetical protein
MNRKMIVAATTAVALTMASCGGKGAAPNTGAYTDQLTSVCRTIGRGIGDLSATTTLDDVRKNATEASGLYEDGLTELKKLTIPTSDKGFAADVKDLITSFEDQLDTLDAIAKAAKENDQKAVDTDMSKLTDQAAESNDLADSLSISRCKLDPVFAATTPTTSTTTTEPFVPLTLPIATVPVQTLPVETLPPETTAPASNKTILSSSDLLPPAGYTWQDVPSNAINGFETLLDLAASMAAQSGGINGVDLMDSGGTSSGRVFAFVSDITPMTPGSFEEVTPILASDTPTTPMTIRNLNGLTWTDPDGTVNFLVGLNNVLLWAFAPTQDSLQFTVETYLDSLPK